MSRLTFILMLMFPLFIAAQDPSQLITEANQLYQDENFPGAIEKYEQILNEGYVSEYLYYNLGNAYYRTGQLGYAILYYEKGLKLSPNDEDLRYNLAIANARTIDQIKEVPKLFIVKWWETFLTLLTINGWAAVLSLFYIVLLISLALYFTARTGRKRRLGFLSGSISLAILVFVTIVFVSSVQREASSNFGVLLQQEVSAKQSPDSKSSDVFVIHEGLKFAIEDQVNDWSKIRLSDGKVGWLPNSSFEPI